MTNAGAKAGDVLLLTKPLGTGIVATALKFDRVDAGLAAEAVQSMRTLQPRRSRSGLAAGAIHACSRVTGFGILGHGSEMAEASGVTLAINARLVPLFSGVLAIAAQNQSRGMGTNQEHFGPGVQMDPAIGVEMTCLLYDPQTSGGLLVAVSREVAGEVQAALAAAGVPAVRIGTVQPAIPQVRIAVHS